METRDKSQPSQLVETFVRVERIVIPFSRCLELNVE